MDLLDIIPIACQPNASLIEAPAHGELSQISCLINGLLVEAIFDSGAVISAVSARWMKENFPSIQYGYDKNSTDNRVVSGPNGKFAALGRVKLTFEFSGPVVTILAPAVVLECDIPPIIGTNIIGILKTMKQMNPTEFCKSQVVAADSPAPAQSPEVAEESSLGETADLVDSHIPHGVESVIAEPVMRDSSETPEEPGCHKPNTVDSQSDETASAIMDADSAEVIEESDPGKTRAEAQLCHSEETACARMDVDSPVVIESVPVATCGPACKVACAELVQDSVAQREKNKTSVEIFAKDLVSRIIKKVKVRGTIDISEADIKRVFERTWAEVEGVDFNATEKTFKNLDKTIHRDLCKTWGGAKMVLLHMKLQKPEFENDIASAVKDHLMTPPRRLSAISKLFSAVGKAIFKPFRCPSVPTTPFPKDTVAAVIK